MRMFFSTKRFLSEANIRKYVKINNLNIYCTSQTRWNLIRLHHSTPLPIEFIDDNIFTIIQVKRLSPQCHILNTNNQYC